MNYRGHPVLACPVCPTTVTYDRVIELRRVLKKALLSGPPGVAIASNQVLNYPDAPRAFLWGSKVILDPIYVVPEGVYAVLYSREGCLSDPGKEYGVFRYPIILASYKMYNKKRQLKHYKDIVLEGRDAIIYQHEVDHLNGICIWEHGAEVIGD